MTTQSRFALPGALRSRALWSSSALVSLGAGAFSLASLSIGMVVLSPAEVLAALFVGDSSESVRRIVLDLRLPRVLAAILGGAALATAGLMLQTLFRNPLASPWILGMTAGAQLGSAMVVVAGSAAGSLVEASLSIFQNLSLVAGAAGGAILIALMMTAIARRVETVTLLLIGVMLGFLSRGLISVLLHFTSRTQGQIFRSWNDGSFAGVVWADMPFLMIPVVLGLLGGILLVKPLNAMLLGETYASSLGFSVSRVRRLILGVSVLLAAPVTAYCGPVLFLGLIVPHFCRILLRSSDHGRLLPVVIPAGAALALAADFLVHLPWEQHFLHLNAILAIIGAPVVIGLLIGPLGRRGYGAQT